MQFYLRPACDDLLMDIRTPDYKNEEEGKEERESEEWRLTLKHLTPIYFNVARSDFDQPWFRKDMTREEVEIKLSQCQPGAFVQRNTIKTKNRSPNP